MAVKGLHVSIGMEAVGNMGAYYIEAVIRRPRSAGRAPGKPSVPFLGTFRESGELLCKKRVLVLPQHSSKVRT